MSERRTVFRTCPLCEACCGLAVTLEGETVVDVRGDDEHVFSQGFICPKGASLGALHHDPDRLQAPLIKRDGVHVEVSWEEAFAEAERLLMPVIERHGRDAVAVYIGNPTVHNLDATLFTKPLVKAIGTRSVFTASTVDQRPKELSSALMFGGPLTIPIPDIDRTGYLLILGANPFESNGSLATAADWPGKIKAIRKRGGKVVVADPRRTRTAANADEHLPIRPGTDALFLAAVAFHILDAGLTQPGRLADFTSGLDALPSLLAPFTPEAVADATGIDAETTRRIAREIAAAPTACVYGRIGTTTQRFGTLASWLVDVINVITGNLDREGGAMFPAAAAGASNTRGSRGKGRAVRTGRFASRVRGLPETFGELPVSCLAEEIDTPGDGQVRALVTVAGNPVVSTPDGARLDRALDSLDCMIAVDVYLNETTRHAHVIFPAPSPLYKPHYDLGFTQLAVRNFADFSPPALLLAGGRPHEWQILAKLALIAQGAGAAADPAIVDDIVATTIAQQAVADDASPVIGMSADEVLVASAPRRGPERLLDIMLRTGPYGGPGGLSVEELEKNEHGIDLGPLQPRMPDVLRTQSGMIEAAPPMVTADLSRLEAALRDTTDAGRLMLVGRRHLRSNNSWFHNLPAMVKGKPRCTLQIHPDDAARFGVKDASDARVSSDAGEVVALVEVTEDIRPGVVSLPHGWGHDAAGARMSVAAAHAGVNSNVLTPSEVDPLSGTAVLNGILVSVTPA